MPHWSTLSLSPIQIRNVGTGLCADTKHGALGSLLRLENCIRGRGEAAWNNMQVRATPGNWPLGALLRLWQPGALTGQGCEGGAAGQR